MNENTMFQPNAFFEKRGHCWISEGIAPVCGFRQNPSPHYGLPVGEENYEARSRYVMPQGTFLAVQEGYMVKANGGIQDEVVYSALDASSGVLKDLETKVEAGDTKVFVANKPIGVTVWDLLQNPLTLPNEFQTHLLQTMPTVRTQGVFVLPIVTMTEAAINDSTTIPANLKADLIKLVNELYDFKVGDLVAPDSMQTFARELLVKKVSPTADTGRPRKYNAAEITMSPAGIAAGLNTIPACSVEQIVARVIAVETDTAIPRPMALVKTDGVDVQGDATHGFDRILWNAFKNTYKTAEHAKYRRRAVMFNVNK